MSHATKAQIAKLLALQERARRQQEALDRTRRAWEDLATVVMVTDEWKNTSERLGLARIYDFGDVLA